jgi:predicted permease
VLRDLQFALRQLIKRPGFTAVAVLTLALGIGVNTTMFSILNALVLQSSPAPDSGRLAVVIGTSDQTQNRYHSPGDYYDFEKQATSYKDLAAYDNTSFNLSEPGQPAERLAGMAVSANFFKVFGISPEAGNVFGPEFDRAGAPKVAVLSDGFWKSHFGRDPSVVGRSLRLDGEPFTVLGVMPPEFDNPTVWGRVEVWQPLAYDGASRQIRDNNWLGIIGRLRDGASLQQAQAEASAIAARIAHDHPVTNSGVSVRLETWNRARTSDTSRRISWLCMGLAGFVLLIACANLANLQLARMSERIREHAVRIALGATRLQLVRQLLVESLLLSALGAGAGMLIAGWGIHVIDNQINISGVDGLATPINTPVLVFTLIASVLTGIAVGAIPAWMATRADVNAALKQGSRGSTSDRSRHLFRQALIVCELALALILLTGASYFVRGMQRVSHADMGWKPEGITTASLVLPYNGAYSSDAQCRAFYDKLQAKLEGLPGVQGAAIATYIPITGFWRNESIAAEGRPPVAHGTEPLAYFDSVSPGYFSTLGIHVERGRGFTDADRPATMRVAVVNEAMAKVMWPGQDPVGKRFQDVDPQRSAWLEVVGVINDVHPTLDLVQAPTTRFQVYIPLAQVQSGFAHWLNVAIRSTAPGTTLTQALRAAMLQIDPDQPISAVVSAPEGIEQLMRGFTLTGELLSAFSFIGLVLSAVGIYGVIANLVAQRTAEIGIRMALGAQSGDVLWMILAQGLRLSAIGAAIGLACSWGLVRVLDSILPAIPGGDPAAVALMACVLAAVALVACWLPAQRAARVDPMIALRSD